MAIVQASRYSPGSRSSNVTAADSPGCVRARAADLGRRRLEVVLVLAHDLDVVGQPADVRGDDPQAPGVDAHVLRHDPVLVEPQPQRAALDSTGSSPPQPPSTQRRTAQRREHEGGRAAGRRSSRVPLRSWPARHSSTSSRSTLARGRLLRLRLARRSTSTPATSRTRASSAAPSSSPTAARAATRSTAGAQGSAIKVRDRERVDGPNFNTRPEETRRGPLRDPQRRLLRRDHAREHRRRRGGRGGGRVPRQVRRRARAPATPSGTPAAR